MIHLNVTTLSFDRLVLLIICSVTLRVSIAVIRSKKSVPLGRSDVFIDLVVSSYNYLVASWLLAGSLGWLRSLGRTYPSASGPNAIPGMIAN